MDKHHDFQAIILTKYTHHPHTTENIGILLRNNRKPSKHMSHQLIFNF